MAKLEIGLCRGKKTFSLSKWLRPHKRFTINNTKVLFGSRSAFLIID
jgi:hypothetical protein